MTISPLAARSLARLTSSTCDFVDVAQPHRTHGAHIVDQHLGGAGRHVGQEELAHRLRGALERDRELVFLDVAHQRLRRARIELDQIVEREHQRLDALGALAIVLFQRGEEAGFGLPVEIVEDLGHHLMGVAPPRLREVRHEFGTQRGFDPLQDLLLHRLHAQHAVDDVQRQLLGQDREHPRGVIRSDLREHDGHGLRIFVLEIIGEHLFLDVGELLPHVAAGRPADFVHDVADPFGRQILLQQTLGRVIGAHQGARRRHPRHEFKQQILDQLGLDIADRGHDDGDFTQLVVVEQAPDLGAVLFAEREHEHGGALRPGEFPLFLRGLRRARAGDEICQGADATGVGFEGGWHGKSIRPCSRLAIDG